MGLFSRFAGPHPRSLALGGGLPAAPLRRLALAAGAFRLVSRPPLPPNEAYALWADTYPPWPHNPLMVAEQSVVASIIAGLAPSRALDAGTGTGRYLPILASSGARTVVGLDLSLPMLGRRSDDTPRVCGDACLLPFPTATFDLVCSSLMAGDIKDLGAWVREASRVLAPGGHLVYSDFHPSWALKRWRRTFKTADGRSFELSYYPHAIEDHLALLGRQSLVVRAIREPRVEGRRAPVVVVFHSVKPGPPAVLARPRMCTNVSILPRKLGLGAAASAAAQTSNEASPPASLRFYSSVGGEASLQAMRRNRPRPGRAASDLSPRP